MFALEAVSIVYMIVALAGLVILFWLAITAIRAMNIYIAKNRVSSMRNDQDYGARL